MKIGVISDTHDQIEQILKAVEIFNQEEIELLVHCGDWVSPFTLKFYKGLKCPIKGVFGNNDGDRFRHLQRAHQFQVELTYEERFMSLQLGGRKIAIYHGDYREITDALIACAKYDVVFHGHSHGAENQIIGQTLSLNPGTLMKVTDQTVKGASVAVYDTKTNSAKIIKL